VLVVNDTQSINELAASIRSKDALSADERQALDAAAAHLESASACLEEAAAHRLAAESFQMGSVIDLVARMDPVGRTITDAEAVIYNVLQRRGGAAPLAAVTRAGTLAGIPIDTTRKAAQRAADRGLIEMVRVGKYSRLRLSAGMKIVGASVEAAG
jgi:hypothetical protein